MTPEPPNALTATWAKHEIAQLLTVYEDEIERSGCFPFQEDREEWHGSGWHAFEIRDEILRRFKTLLDQADEAARLSGEVERLRAALSDTIPGLECAFEFSRARSADDEIEARERLWRARAALTPPEPS